MQITARNPYDAAQQIADGINTILNGPFTTDGDAQRALPQLQAMESAGNDAAAGLRELARSSDPTSARNILEASDQAVTATRMLHTSVTLIADPTASLGNLRSYLALAATTFERVGRSVGFE